MTCIKTCITVILIFIQDLQTIQMYIIAIMGANLNFIHIILKINKSQFSSVQSFSCVWLFESPWTTVHQASLSVTNSWSLLKLMWCHATVSSSVVPFSSCLQSFPASGSLPMSHFFESGGQSTGVSPSASVLPLNIQDWFHLGQTGLISLKFKELPRVFSNTTV